FSLSSCCSDPAYLVSFPPRRSSDLGAVRIDGPAAVLRSVEERTAVVIRLLAVASVGLALVVAPGLARGRAGLLGVLVAAALVYRSEEHTSELQSRENLVCRLLLEKK